MDIAKPCFKYNNILKESDDVLYSTICLTVSLTDYWEDIQKKAAYFWTLSKRGGVKPESKSFGGRVFGASSWTFSKRGGGGEPIPKVFGKFLGSFFVWYFLGFLGRFWWYVFS